MSEDDREQEDRCGRVCIPGIRGLGLFNGIGTVLYGMAPRLISCHFVH